MAWEPNVLFMDYTSVTQESEDFYQGSSKAPLKEKKKVIGSNTKSRKPTEFPGPRVGELFFLENGILFCEVSGWACVCVYGCKLNEEVLI